MDCILIVSANTLATFLHDGSGSAVHFQQLFFSSCLSKQHEGRLSRAEMGGGGVGKDGWWGEY